MGILGGAIGAGIGAIGSIFGGISASKAMKRARNNIKQQQQKNENWYNRRYNEDATQRADAQMVLTRLEDSIRSRNKEAAGTQAVMGGTDESVAIAKEANNKAVADATAQIAINGERRKDMIESQYQSKEDALQQQLNDIEMNKARNVSQATSGVVQAGANIAGIL